MDPGSTPTPEDAEPPPLAGSTPAPPAASDPAGPPPDDSETLLTSPADTVAFNASKTRRDLEGRREATFHAQGTRVDALDRDGEAERFQGQGTRLDLPERHLSFSGSETRLDLSDPTTREVHEPTRRADRPGPKNDGLGIKVGPYFLEDRLGEGGMASVFLARGPSGDAVALKVLSAAIDDETVRARFQREGDVFLGLDHPSIVRLLARGEDERSGRPYLVMELVEGRDLGEILNSRPTHRLSCDEVLVVLERCAQALLVAHERGIVHRDVKPGNLILTPHGEVKLTDFGIALDQGAQSRLTTGGALVGTPSYLAPEVLLGDSWSPAADLYALGSTAFEALTGEALFGAETAIEILSDQIQTPAPKLATLTDVPLWVNDLVDRLLSKDPAQRPTAQELLETLEPHLCPPETLEELWRAANRSPRKRGAAVQSVAAASPGDTVLHYVLREELGRGAVGVVYRAFHEGLKKDVALKLLDALSLVGGSTAEREKREVRFLREAQAAASLKHPCVVPILDAGRHAGFFYIAMELVEGQLLTELFSAETLSFDERAGLVAQLAAGVAHAHARGVIHRDLKPDNVIVDEESTPRVLDFGVAKVAEQDDATSDDLEITTEGTLVGTIQYMAPEQAAGKHSLVDVRSDVYALGVILYEGLCGRPPHLGSVSELLYLINFEDPLPPSAHRDSVPWELDAICLKALERSRDDRYQSALEFSRDIERYLAGEAILAKAGSLRYQLRKYVELNRAKVVTGLLVSMLVLAILGSWATSAAAHRAEQARLAVEEDSRQAGKTYRRHEAIRTLAREGWTLFQAGRYGAAAERLSAAQAQILPDDLIAPSKAELTKLPPEAVADLALDERAHLRLTRDRLRQWILLARAAAARGQIDQALAAARAALEANDLETATKQAITATSLGGSEVTKAVSEEIAARYRQRAKTLTRKASLADSSKERRQKLEQARAFLEEAERLIPQGAQAELGLVLRQLGKLSELEQSVAVARAQAKRASELATQGQTQLQSGELEAARRAFEQALGNDGSNVQAREGVVLVERALREQEETRALAKQVQAAEDLRAEAERAREQGKSRYGQGELPDAVQESYTTAIEALRRSALLDPGNAATSQSLREVSREYAVILIDQGQLELAKFVRRIGGLPERDPDPPPLPRDPHLGVIEVVGASASAAFGSPVVFQPTRAFNALRAFVASQTQDLRFELRVLGAIKREGLHPKVYCTGIEIRMFDRRRNTVSPPKRVLFDKSYLRPAAVDPQGRRVFRSFTRAQLLEAKPYLARVRGIVQQMVSANRR